MDDIYAEHLETLILKVISNFVTTSPGLEHIYYEHNAMHPGLT